MNPVNHLALSYSYLIQSCVVLLFLFVRFENVTIFCDGNNEDVRTKYSVKNEKSLIYLKLLA